MARICSRGIHAWDRMLKKASRLGSLTELTMNDHVCDYLCTSSFARTKLFLLAVQLACGGRAIQPWPTWLTHPLRTEPKYELLMADDTYVLYLHSKANHASIPGEGISPEILEARIIVLNNSPWYWTPSSRPREPRGGAVTIFKKHRRCLSVGVLDVWRTLVHIYLVQSEPLVLAWKIQTLIRIYHQ